jgi:rod shape-determining protein MreD
MRILRAFALLAVAVVVHFVGMRIHSGFSVYLDVFLVVIVLQALSGETFWALLLGLTAGLVQDSLLNGPIGLYGFADTLVAYATARLAQRLVIQKATSVLGVVAFASIVQQAVLVTLAFLLLPDPSLPQPWVAAVKALASGLLGMVLYAAGERLGTLLESRKSGSAGRIRLG